MRNRKLKSEQSLNSATLVYVRIHSIITKLLVTEEVNTINETLITS